MAHHLCCRTASAASTSARLSTPLHTVSTAAGHCRFRVWNQNHTASVSLSINGRGHIGVAAHGRQQGEHTMCCASAASAAASGGLTAAEDLEPTVEEVMTLHPLVLQADMNIKEAVHVMLDKDISGAPVVDASGKLVGVLSETDLIWKGAGVPQDHFLIPPVFLGFADAFISLRDNPKIEEEVRDAMTSKVEVASPTMPMSQAASLMLAKQINMLPVVDEGKVVGVLTRHDVLRGIYASKSPFL